MNFTGKVILVTGASSGIGAATALHLAKLDAKLAITGRNVEQLDKVSESCQSVSKNKPLVIQADLTSEEDTKRIIDTVVKHYQKLNVLVNNAGMFYVTCAFHVKSWLPKYIYMLELIFSIFNLSILLIMLTVCKPLGKSFFNIGTTVTISSVKKYGN
jgi:Dehydrogenases with different specificities (related to short-chain alcohol dehydrogenases)